MSKARILHVDDSAVIRSIIKRIIETDDGLELVAAAKDGQEGIDLYKQYKPDIVLMDIEMPVMNGIQSLEQIIKFDPKAKVIMCSTLTVDNAEITLRAMKIGALDYIAKPTSANVVNSSDEFRSQLLHLLNNFRSSFAQRTEAKIVAGMPTPMLAPQLREKPPLHWHPKVIAIGSSTGGPQALLQLMKEMTNVSVPIVITQHMPATFTALLAKNIETSCGIICHEAQNDMVLKAGEAILAQGGKHMEFTNSATGEVIVKLSDAPPVNFCKPAVDPMLRSLLHFYGGQVLTVILTGMGSDGRDGTKDIVAQGGYCIAQDQDSSVVWGMPGAVALEGLCSAIEPLNTIPQWIKGNIKL